MLKQKGINYDTGTDYVKHTLSREIWNEAVMRHEMRVIAQDLHCNAVTLFGSDIKRLADCAAIAAEYGLYVWIQPRMIDSSPAEMIENLAAVASEAERLRLQYPKIGLNIGCELTIFSSGMIPGGSYGTRAMLLGLAWPLVLPFALIRLGSILKKARVAARSNFDGKITYGSGLWESVNWADFDYVGVNLYREGSNWNNYGSALNAYRQHGKPVIITEFGYCSFDGAAKMGPTADSIVDWSKYPNAEIKSPRVRNERVQADGITDLIRLYNDADIFGAFVFEFVEPLYTHSDDPKFDLDMASFGIVKVPPQAPDAPVLHWERKLAFDEIARLYKDIVR